jgi:hypothetical protein
MNIIEYAADFGMVVLVFFCWILVVIGFYIFVRRNG